MRSLYIPIPVALFIRRLFNVFSSITISNQYLLAKKSEAVSSGSEEASRGEPPDTCHVGSVRSEVLLGSAEPNLRAHWGRLKPWPWSVSKEQSAPRWTHTTVIDEGKHQGTFNNEKEFDEKTMPPNDPPPSRPDPAPSRARSDAPLSPIYTLMNNPTLFNPVRIPRNPVVLCHGLYGYDVRGPSNFPMLQLHYWANVLKVLKKKIGAEVIVTGVPGTGSIASRAERLHEYLREKAPGRDINFMGHSMGGLDCRYLITHVKPEEYHPVSLTSICTPHRGSPFMDWCKETIGIGKLQRQAKETAPEKEKTETLESSSSFSLASLASLPSSLTTFLLSVVDSPAYANLTTHYLQDVFNPSTPDDPRVRYYSIAARTDSMSVIHPLWLPKTILDSYEGREREAHPYPDEVDWGNDGLVTVRSAKWGEFLGTMEGCDHWDVRGGGGLGATDTEWHLDLTLPSGLKSSLSDPLSIVNSLNWREWTRWRKEEAEREKASGNLAVKGTQKPDTGLQKATISGVEGPESSSSDSEDDAMLKSSTDKLSAVFDWVSDQVASSKKPSSSSSSSGAQPASSETPETIRKTEKERVDAKKARETPDERMKFDLERFYVALCRKLYDDGL